MNPKVDAFLSNAKQWREEYMMLRTIVLGCRLDEELKWGVPCYTHGGKNIVIIHGFKEYCALLFFKGALLRDPAGILVQQTENTQAARQIRFTGPDQIAAMEPLLKSYILEAVEAEKAGLKVAFRKNEEFPLPEEFRRELDETPGLKEAFGALTPGRQRAYMIYFSSAKQPATRASRVEKSIPRILRGKGLDDK